MRKSRLIDKVLNITYTGSDLLNKSSYESKQQKNVSHQTGS